MYYSAGYYVVRPRFERRNGHRFTYVPYTLSVSEVVSDIYPGSGWAFERETSSGYVPKLNLPAEFRVNSTDFNEIQTWIYTALNRGAFGYPNLFYNLETAREFQSTFSRHLPDTKTLGIFLHEKHSAKALDEVYSEAGIQHLLKHPIIEPKNGIYAGFDLLGLEASGDYEHFSYYIPDQIRQEKFGIELNTLGLFNDEASCERVIEFTSNTAQETVLWLPFKVKVFA